jgi:hypothetical protein
MGKVEENELDDMKGRAAGKTTLSGRDVHREESA